MSNSPTSSSLPPISSNAARVPADGDSRALGRIAGVDPRSLIDLHARRVEYLRISVTDRCNYRCVYCMPAEGVRVAPKADILQFEEIEALARAFVACGVRRLRLTGGEPTIRKDIVTLVARLAAIPGVADLAMTTNGHHLARLAAPLARAGLQRVNVSIDSLRPEVFSRLTRGGDVGAVLDGLRAAKGAGLGPIKLNAVVIRGENEDELSDLVAFGGEIGAVVRFIEYMPVGVDGFHGDGPLVPVAKLRARLSERYVLEAPSASSAIPGGGPASYVLARPREGGPAVSVGFIAALSERFCERCNRVRLSADGLLRECLSVDGALSLRDLLRSGADAQTLVAAIRDALSLKVDGHRFAEGRRTCTSMSSIGG